MSKIKVFEFEGKKITFDFGDGNEMINATEIVKAFKGKRLENFSRLKQTKDFIKALEKSMNTAKPSDVRVWKKAVKSVRGGDNPDLRGTWYEKRLALKLAAWLSPEFEVWVFSKIEELLTTGQTTLSDDKIIIDKKTFQFIVDKHKASQNDLFYFLDALAKGQDENE